MNMLPGFEDMLLPDMPAEEEIPYRTVRQVIPGLRKLLAIVQEMSVAWNTPANRIPQQITDAYANGTTLAGYAPEAWDEWGQTFMAIMTAINTPNRIVYNGGANGTAEKSAVEVMATRYVKQ